jgi:P4 family phage/plasmid primase-like protien
MTCQQFLNHFPNFVYQVFNDNQETKQFPDPMARTIKPSNTSDEQLKQYNAEGRGIFFSVNQFPDGIRKIEQLKGINAWFAESDDLTLEEQQANLNSLKLQPSFIVQSKKSLHAYWLAKDATIENFKLIQHWIKIKLNGCNSMKDYTRVLRVPDFYHMKDPQNPFLVKIISEHPELVYTEKEIMDYFVDYEQIKKDEEEHQKRMAELANKIQTEGEDVYQAINNIPIEDIVSKIMNWRWDGKKHWYALGSNSPSACFKASDGNYIVHGGTQHFSDLKDGYSPFEFVKMKLQLSNAETFDYFKENYRSIKILSTKKQNEFAQAEINSLENKLNNSEEEIKEERVDWKKIIKSKKDDGLFLLAQYLIKKNKYLTYGENTRTLYLYKDGYYQNAIHYIKNHIQDVLKALANKKNISEIENHIMIATYQGKYNDEFDNINLINLQNGTFDIINKKLLPHNSEHKLFNKIPITYDQTKDCPNIMSFLKSVVNEENIPIIQEWVGFMLYRSYFIKKALIVTGPPNTGKTTFMNLLEKFIGKGNYSAITLQNLAIDKFAGQALLHKHVNICDELSAFDIKDTNPFKKATGGSSMNAEKKFQDAVSFHNYAKLIFACNRIPVVLDIDDDAYFDRWIIMQFDKKITKEDKFLSQKISTPEELSGFLNFALIGLYRLLENQKFSVDADKEEIKKIMLRNASSVAAFSYDRLENPDDPYLTITKEDMYKEYCKYCRQYNIVIETMDFFGKHLRDYAKYIESKGGKNRHWSNVIIRGFSTNLFDDTPIEPPTPLEEFYTDGDTIGMAF